MNMKKSMAVILIMIYALCIGGCSSDGDSASEKEALAVNDITSSTTPKVTENTLVISTEESALENTTTDNNISSSTAESEMNITTQPIVNNGQGGGNPAPSFTIPVNNNQNNFQDNSIGNNNVNNNVNNNGNNNNGNNSTGIPVETVETANGNMDISGKSEVEWIAEAQELYKEGCNISYRYLCTGSEFPFDRDNLEILDKTYFLTTCTSFEDATAPYEIFSREYHDSDFDDLLVSQNGKLYAARFARGMDMTYISSEVESLKSVSDKEIVFNVVVEYEDSKTTNEFTLVPEDGVWKIGKFTLPY